MEKFLRGIQRLSPSDAAEGKIGSIELNLWLAQLVGLPLLGLKRETPLQRLCIVTVGVGVLFALFFYITFELCDLYLNWQDLDAFTQNLVLSLTHISCWLKVCNTFYHYASIKAITKHLRSITSRCVRSEQQVETFQKAELKNKLANLIYFVLVLLPGILSVFYIFASPEDFTGNRFPYRAEMPDFLPRYIQSLYMGLGVSLLALQTVTIDFLNISLMGQICMHLKVLNLAFDELPNVETVKSDGKLSTKTYNWLVDIVKYHCELIVLRQQVERIFNLPVMLQLVISLVIVAMTLFQVIAIGDGSKSSMIMNLMLCCLLCQLFLYCYFGNEVYEQSKTLPTSGFSCNWHALDRRCKKTLLIFMINAERPFLFTAGGFMALTLPSFTYLMSKSYSIVAVLRQMYSRS